MQAKEKNMMYQIKKKIEEFFNSGIRFERICIRDTDIDYDTEIIRDTGRISSMLRPSIYGFYDNGLQIIDCTNTSIIKDENENWDIIKYKDERTNQYKIVSKILVLGLLPFSGITKINFKGDNFCNEPIITCRFDFNESPYEGFEYLEVCNTENSDEPNYYPLSVGKRRKLPLKQ